MDNALCQLGWARFLVGTAKIDITFGDGRDWRTAIWAVRWHHEFDFASVTFRFDWPHNFRDNIAGFSDDDDVPDSHSLTCYFGWVV